MSASNMLKSALVFSIFAGIVVADCGPLASPAFAQRPNRDRDNDDDEERVGDEGGNRGEGRRGWGGRRRGGGGFGGGDEGERRGRERQRNENDDEERDNDGDEDGGPRIEAWARNLVKENDKNGDMMLQEDERSGLRGPVARADLDNDKVVTVEEIVRSLSNRESPERGRRDRRASREGEGSGSESTAKSEGATKKRVYTSVSASSGTGKEKEADKRKSYRFTPAQERLTGDLPSWFKSRDRNKDGQVSMSEYGRSWNARLVRQFQDVDLNDDGVITAKEAAE
jgi:EF hand